MERGVRYKIAARERADMVRKGETIYATLSDLSLLKLQNQWLIIHLDTSRFVHDENVVVAGDKFCKHFGKDAPGYLCKVPVQWQ